MMRTILDRPSPAGAPSDAKIVARSLEDPDAFGEIAERHMDPIYRFVAARVGPVHAEDVVAETFAIAFDRRRQFDLDADSARPWLYGIAANRLRRHHEAERRWLERSVLEPATVVEPQEALADARVDAQQLSPELHAALATLSRSERDVLLLFALEELTHEQIARVLGIRRGAAKVRLSRGCARLRAQLEHIRSDEETP